MEERRRRRIAFENLAKGSLRYLDNCNEVKVGITELQERVDVPVQSVFPFSRWRSRREVKMAKRFSKYSGKKKKRSMLLAGPDGMRSGKA